MPAASARPPPVANSRHSASAPTCVARGARTLTVYPPRAFGVRIACARSGRGRRKLVAERAAHPTAPGGVGENVDRRPTRRSLGLQPSRLIEIARAGAPELVEQRLGLDEAERIGAREQHAVQRGRMNEQIGFAVAVSVVRDAFAELAQRRNGARVEPQRAGELVRHGDEIVAERRDDRPDPLPARRARGRRSRRCKRRARCRCETSRPDAPAAPPHSDGRSSRRPRRGRGARAARRDSCRRRCRAPSPCPRASRECARAARCRA